MGYTLGVGSRLGKYEIVGHLGRGGAANVFQAKNVETGELFALKTMAAETVANEEIHKRFIREISVAQKLAHENIIKYGECDLHEEVLYYTMEMVPWGSLGDAMRGRRIFPWRDVVECGIDLCRGLEHLHAAGIVHRDLKPQNIFLSDDGKLKIGDFGLARDFASSRLTIEGQTVGTAKYLAPEQACAGNLDGRTDIYALGCILFEMLAGRPPFQSDESQGYPNTMFLMQQHVEVPPPLVSDFSPQCPPALVELVNSMLSKSPQNRPDTAAQAASQLADILADPTMKFVPKESLEPESVEPKLLTERLQQSGAADERKVNLKTLVAMAVVAAVIVVGIVIAGAMR